MPVLSYIGSALPRLPYKRVEDSTSSDVRPSSISRDSSERCSHWPSCVAPVARQLSLPMVSFFSHCLSVLYTRRSTMPATVKTPPKMAHS